MTITTNSVNGNGKTTAVAIEAELISARDAARLCGVSVPSWWRLHAAAKVPSPLKLGGRTLWRAAELRAWIVAGCPDRMIWRVSGPLAAAQRNGRA